VHDHGTDLDDLPGLCSVGNSNAGRIAIAEFSDGTIWTEQARVMVAVGACDTLPEAILEPYRDTRVEFRNTAKAGEVVEIPCHDHAPDGEWFRVTARHAIPGAHHHGFRLQLRRGPKPSA